MSEADGSEAVGSLADEAVKLVGALSAWVREQGGGVSDLAGGLADSMADELHDHLATESPECLWCPVCRTVAVVRRTSPEVRAHLTDAASSLALALSGIMSTRVPSREGGVERIDLDDDVDHDVDDGPGDRPEDGT